MYSNSRGVTKKLQIAWRLFGFAAIALGGNPMLARAELGCPVSGSVGAGAVACNGHTVPPIGSRK